MVDRCEITNFRPCTVIDLDGTLVDGNTLKIYLDCGLRYLLSRRKFSSVLRLLKAVTKRKLRRCNHRQMKEVILTELFPYTDILSDFTRRINKHINPEVRKLIENNTAKGHSILMATAAPGFYVRPFWSGNLVATDFLPDRPLTECVRDEKVRRVSQWLEKNNCRLDTVVTDSADDLGLVKMNISGTNILVKPKSSDLRAFRELKPAHLLLIE